MHMQHDAGAYPLVHSPFPHLCVSHCFILAPVIALTLGVHSGILSWVQYYSPGVPRRVLLLRPLRLLSTTWVATWSDFLCTILASSWHDKVAFQGGHSCDWLLIQLHFMLKHESSWHARTLFCCCLEYEAAVVFREAIAQACACSHFWAFCLLQCPAPHEFWSRSTQQQEVAMYSSTYGFWGNLVLCDASLITWQVWLHSADFNPFRCQEDLDRAVFALIFLRESSLQCFMSQSLSQLPQVGLDLSFSWLHVSKHKLFYLQWQHGDRYWLELET